ncbi:hypothetical protein GQR58_022736 [Nymphon striatum]|nr:hypothetical protein GQR58_022736 [Nymphon striatum]
MHSKGEELQQKMPAYRSVVVGSVASLWSGGIVGERGWVMAMEHSYHQISALTFKASTFNFLNSNTLSGRSGLEGKSFTQHGSRSTLGQTSFHYSIDLSGMRKKDPEGIYKSTEKEKEKGLREDWYTRLIHQGETCFAIEERREFQFKISKTTPFMEDSGKTGPDRVMFIVRSEADTLKRGVLVKIALWIKGEWRALFNGNGQWWLIGLRSVYWLDWFRPFFLHISVSGLFHQDCLHILQCVSLAVAFVHINHQSDKSKSASLYLCTLRVFLFFECSKNLLINCFFHLSLFPIPIMQHV